MNEIKPNAKALLPVGVFLILYIGGGIAFHEFLRYASLHSLSDRTFRRLFTKQSLRLRRKNHFDRQRIGR